VQGTVTTTVSIGATGVTSVTSAGAAVASLSATTIAVGNSSAGGEGGGGGGGATNAKNTRFIAVSVVVLPFILLAIWVILYQRKRRAQRLAEDQEKEKGGEGYTPLGGRHELDPDARVLPQEAPAAQRHELAARPNEVEGDLVQVHELDGRSRPGELG